MDAAILSKICRICCNRRINDLIFLLDADNKSIIKKLRACADIIIEHDDLMPKYICTKCLPKLNLAYNFKIQCEYMDQKLRESFVSAVKKQDSLPLTIQSLTSSSTLDDSTTVDDSFTEDVSSTFDLDSDQLTMDDINTIIDEECVGEEQPMEFEIWINPEQSDQHHQVGVAIQAQTNDALNAIANDADKNAMDINMKIADIDKFDSLGSLPSAKNTAENSDQDMFSVKSDSQFSPKDKEPYKCGTCSETFSIHSDYRKHLRSHGKNRFQCLVCSKWFEMRYLLNAHQKTHSGAKNHECSLCQKRFTTKTNLNRHIRVFHQQQKFYKCSSCQKKFSQLSILRVHQSVHMAERAFNCDICNNAFKSEVHLRVHKRRHMLKTGSRQKLNPPKKIYKAKPKPCVCKECDKQFNSVALLKSHMQSHSMEKKYECNICKRRFSFQQTLRNHMFLHTGEKRFKCDVCDISFRQIGHLQAHKLTHTQIKPHVCSSCGKAFTLRGNLTIHMRTHNTEKPFQCTICPRKFTTSNTLKRHYLMHQRKNQTKLTIEQILKAPIIEASGTDTSVPEAISNPETIQFMQTSEIVGENPQLIFKIQ